jgi:hypothetical protein
MAILEVSDSQKAIDQQSIKQQSVLVSRHYRLSTARRETSSGTGIASYLVTRCYASSRRSRDIPYASLSPMSALMLVYAPMRAYEGLCRRIVQSHAQSWTAVHALPHKG